jgi:hypothetical protein
MGRDMMDHTDRQGLRAATERTGYTRRTHVARLITQRSQVQILAPLLRNRRSSAGFREVENRHLIVWPSFDPRTDEHGTGVDVITPVRTDTLSRLPS